MRPVAVGRKNWLLPRQLIALF
ncbi:hypothetical protein LL067_19685 [Yersinia pseudotuberculosis]